MCEGRKLQRIATNEQLLTSPPSLESKQGRGERREQSFSWPLHVTLQSNSKYLHVPAPITPCDNKYSTNMITPSHQSQLPGFLHFEECVCSEAITFIRNRTKDGDGHFRVFLEICLRRFINGWDEHISEYADKKSINIHHPPQELAWLIVPARKSSLIK